MTIEGYIDYQRREFCKDLPCPIQVLLDATTPNSQEYDRIRGICQSNCIHTTYEFHHWLIQKGYLLIRPTEKSQE
jgi:hypothetical protein